MTGYTDAPDTAGHYRTGQFALAHFRNLVQHRTNPDGSAKKGYTRNVEQLRREIARLEGTTAPSTEAVATEPADA